MIYEETHSTSGASIYASTIPIITGVRACSSADRAVRSREAAFPMFFTAKNRIYRSRCIKGYKNGEPYEIFIFYNFL